MSNDVNKKAGNRQPSPRLHQITRKWTEDEWRQFVAFAKVYGSGSHNLRLLELVRSMAEGYRPDLERKHFKDQNLPSLRYKAIRYSYNTGRRLDLIQDYDLMKLHGNIQLALQKCSYEDAAEFLNEALEMASAKEDFSMIELFLIQERALIAASMAGDQRITAMQHNGDFALSNAENIRLAASIAKAQADYLEAPRNQYAATSKVDPVAVKAYFASSMHQSSLDGFPASLRIERLKVDEFAHYLLGDYENASQAAEAQFQIYEQHPALRAHGAVKYSKNLMNLAAYYSELELHDKAKSIVLRLEQTNPTSEQGRNHYLIYYLLVSFQVAIDTGDWSLGKKALKIWEQFREHVLAMSKSNGLRMMLLQICTYHVAFGNHNLARRDFSVLNDWKESFKWVSLKAIYMVLHLILLFDENDEIGLESHGRNYKRQLKKMGTIALPALEIATVLQRQKDLETAGKRPDFAKLVPKLEAFSNSSEHKRSLFYREIILWLESR